MDLEMRTGGIAALLLCALLCGKPSDSRLIQNVSWPPVGPQQYELFEVRFTLEDSIENPFDADEVRVYALFHTPSGRREIQPGAYFGPDDWRVRYAPREEGLYRASIVAETRHTRDRCPSFEFSVSPADSPGFIRIHPEDPRYFAFDNGDWYFPLGENVAWASSLEEYETYFRKLSAARCNWVRIWMSPWGRLALEWIPRKDEDAPGEMLAYPGLHRYATENADRLDQVLALADKHDLYVQLVLLSHGLFSTTTDSEWKDNPYNVARGGFLQSPEAFFSNRRARKLYRHQLRYISARWGYHRRLMAWELWNEVNWTDGYYAGNEKAVGDWHREMAQYLRSQDPAGHLITTSGSEGAYEMKSLDFNQLHSYDPQLPLQLAELAPAMLAHNRPYFCGEIGDDPHSDSADPEGTFLHNAIWMSLMHEAGGGAMSWWWKSYVERNNLYYHFHAFASFVEPLQLPARGLKQRRMYLKGQPEERDDLVIRSYRWWTRTPAQHFKVTPEKVSNLHNYKGVVSGTLNDIVSKPTFEFEIAEPTTIEIAMGNAGARGADFAITLDGRVHAADSIPPSATRGREAQYQRRFVLPVEVGHHHLTFENTGPDYVKIETIVFRQYADRYRIFGMQNEAEAVFWVGTPACAGMSPSRRAAIRSPVNLTALLSDLQDGVYEVGFWNTRSGELFEKGRIEATQGVLAIPLPRFQTDIAATAQRTHSPIAPR